MQPIIVQVSINGKSVPFEVDSGAARSLISPETFNTLVTSKTQPEMCTSNVVLSTWVASAVLRVIGIFDAQITHKGITKCLPIHVSKENGQNLLGRNWFQPFNISLKGIHQVHNKSAVDSNELGPLARSFIVAKCHLRACSAFTPGAICVNSCMRERNFARSIFCAQYLLRAL